MSILIANQIHDYLFRGNQQNKYCQQIIIMYKEKLILGVDYYY